MKRCAHWFRHVAHLLQLAHAGLLRGQRRALDVLRKRVNTPQWSSGHGDHGLFTGDKPSGRTPTANANEHLRASMGKVEGLSSPCGSRSVPQPCRRGRRGRSRRRGRRSSHDRPRRRGIGSARFTATCAGKRNEKKIRSMETSARSRSRRDGGAIAHRSSRLGGTGEGEALASGGG